MRRARWLVLAAVLLCATGAARRAEAQVCCICTNCGGALVYGPLGDGTTECFNVADAAACDDACDGDGCNVPGSTTANAVCDSSEPVCDPFTPTPTGTPTETPTRTPSDTPTATNTATQTPTATPTRTLSKNETTGGLQACSDHIDNDGNGLADCADPACAAVPPCVTPAPALAPPWLFMLTALLALVGGLGAARVLRRE